MRLIDADAFAEYLKQAIENKKYRKLFSDNILSVGDVLYAVVSELEGTGLQGYKNAPTISIPVAELDTTKNFAGWIPCSERLPEECENVLAWIERDAWIDGSEYPKRKQEFAIGWHIDGRWHFDGYAGSTTECLAWMPLPERYGEEASE